MESNITNQQFSISAAPLAQPRFDEEATLLSARPVVPIKDFSVTSRFSRPWIFGFAIIGALLLGGSATAFYYSKFHPMESPSAFTMDTASADLKGVASESVAIDERSTTSPRSGGAESASVDSETPVRVKGLSPSASSSGRPVNSSNAIARKGVQHRVPVVVEASESDYGHRGERRTARKEDRERKRDDRERRAGKDANQLLRIRDIFEGPGRP